MTNIRKPEVFSAMKRSIPALGRAALYILLYVAVQLLVSTVFVVLGAISYFISGVTSTDILTYILQYSAETVAINLLLSSVIALAAFVLVVRVRRNRIRTRFSLVTPTERSSLVAAVPFGLAANLLVSFVIGLLPAPLVESYGDASAVLTATEPNMIYFLATVLFAPFLEEILFRGLVQSTLKRSMKLEFAVLLQAVFFGLIHTGLVWIIYAFILGLALGILRENQRSLWPCVLLHCGFNLTNFLLMLLPYDFFGARPLLYVLVLMVSTVLCILLGYGLFIHTPAIPAAAPAATPIMPETADFPTPEASMETDEPQTDDQNGGN